MKKFRNILLLLLVILMLTSCNTQEVKTPEEIHREKDLSEVEITEEVHEPRVETIRIKAFGDIMFHMPQVRYANNSDGTYNFSESFSEVTEFIKDSDLSIANFESTTNPNRPYNGFPMFNSPPAVFYYIKSAGFDVLSTMNNHSLDTGVEGIETTLDAITAASLKSFGTARVGEEKFEIYDTKDIKIGLLAYSQSLNGLDSRLNTDEKKTMVNRLEEENVKADIEKMKELKCDLILIYPHWGVEYQSQMSDAQIEMAHKMAEWGGDIIIGNHPHVVQPTENYKTAGGRDSFIVYSCGNFLSNQRKETMDGEEGLNIKNTERCEQNIAFEIVIEKNFKEEKTVIKDVIHHPMWVGLRSGEKGRRVVKSHLCEEFLEGGSKFGQVDDYTLSRIKDAYDKTLETTKALNKQE
ncbi:MAG: CapA family protein [Tissierellia bacterium]|jgi:poly-gamma-glutamate capsule biosynthesis protein CapA/YwtB (metallophosphatase superfamily)|nr:CapA family protein [Tissierellia bacterium]